MVALKDGSEVQDPRLDRLYEEDWRSLDYPVGLLGAAMPTKLPVALHRPRSYTWACDLWLNQGVEGACVSTGCAHELAANPVPVEGVTFPWARDNIYFEAQKIDQWPGGEYPGATPRYAGTSVLAGAKVVQKLGFIRSYSWALSLEEAVLGIAYHGPAICGFNWYEGMFQTDAKGYIAPTGKVQGGHCLLAHAVKVVYKRKSWLDFGWLRREWSDVDLGHSYITFHNSWGKKWGENGRAKITLADFGKLLDERGEVCFVTRNETKRRI